LHTRAAKRGTPLKNCFTDIGASKVKTVANRLLIITSTGDELYSGINIKGKGNHAPAGA